MPVFGTKAAGISGTNLYGKGSVRDEVGLILIRLSFKTD
jgi:hypothetical protein